jgi:rhodanese-related sulfurtransferase
MSELNLQYIDACQLKAWIHDDAELALLDVREHGQYGENHLFFAVPLPYSALELEIGRLVPRKAARVVVYGDDASTGAVNASARILSGLGYTSVHVLEGGIEAWKRAGYSTFAGVNLPSKTFGELAEHAYDTPSISADELYRMLNDENENIVVLDGRPVNEYYKMNIPGAICCPNGELALRVGELVPDPKTTIVINCAGRTRSIIGAQTLINLNVPNKVYALENGTQGWYLADYPLEHKSSRVYPQTVSEGSLAALRERSARLVRKFALPSASAEQVRAWLADGERSVFLCDVRTEEEYRQDGLPVLVQHAPGGQLIQATDQYVGVRKARIVLFDSDGIRAPVVASWLKQLGWEVYLLPSLAGLDGEAAASARHRPPRQARVVPREDLAAFIDGHPGVRVLDARPSQEFRGVRIEGSTWVVRPTLMERAAGGQHGPVLLIGPNLGKLELLAQDLAQAGFTDVHLSVVDTAALRASGLPLSTGDDVLADAECIDYLFFVHDRHDGNKEAARKYLEWETNLVSQLDEQERNTFSIGN